MAYIPDEVIQDIRNKTDIVPIIENYVHLTKRGNNYTASCPFHEDRNPSFSVHTGKQIYKCFSCGRGGNVFTFLQDIEQISFVEAVLKVAELSNISLNARYIDQKDFPKESQHQRLLDLHTKVSEFYQYYLMNTSAGEKALSYLMDRNLQLSILEEYKIGLSPIDSSVLYQFLLGAGYQHSELIESGIFYQNNSEQWIDRFNGRIIFPLCNTKGEIVAFSGRVYEQEVSGKKTAKYLNSPETVLFHKTELLFNLDKALPKIRQLNQVLICEGYMDVIALAQAGFYQTVATMGTSLTENHLKQLIKLTPNIVFVFDGDEAGQKATLRAFDLLESFPQQQAKSILIPYQMDPDEWIKTRGKEAFQQLINQASTRYDVYKNKLKTTYDLSDSTQLAQYVEELVLQISKLVSPIERELRIHELSQSHQISENLLHEQLSQYLRKSDKRETEIKPINDIPITDSEYVAINPDIQSQRAFQSEKYLLASLIYYEDAWRYLQQLSEPLTLFHQIAQKTFFVLSDAYYEKGLSFPLSQLVNYVTDTEISRFFTTLLWEQEPLGYSDEMMADCLQIIKQEFLQQYINELRDKAKQYEREQRHADMNELMLKIIQLNRQLKQINH